MEENGDDEIKKRIESGSLYTGSGVPLGLKLIWGIFIIWGVIYFITNVIPDLKVWLAK